MADEIKSEISIADKAVEITTETTPVKADQENIVSAEPEISHNNEEDGIPKTDLTESEIPNETAEVEGGNEATEELNEEVAH